MGIWLTDLLCHWWWKAIFVFQLDICFSTTQITFRSIVLFLHWILSKSVRFLLETIFWILNFKPDDQKCYFQTRHYIGISSKQCIVYCLTKLIPVCINISIYWFTPNMYMWFRWITCILWVHSVGNFDSLTVGRL